MLTSHRDVLQGDFSLASSSKEESPSPLHRQGSGAQWGQPDVKPYSPRRGVSMQVRCGTLARMGSLSSPCSRELQCISLGPIGGV